MAQRKRGNNEGSIRKRKDGRWEARFSAHGKQRSIYGRTREDAIRKMRAALRSVDEGLPIVDGRTTLGDFLDRWLKDSVKPRLRPRTYSSYEMHVRVHLKPALGNIPLLQLQPAHVQQFLNSKLSCGLSPASIARIRATLRAALNQALRWGEVHRNVATLVDTPRQAQHEVDPLSPDQARAFLDHISGHRWYPLYTLALLTGLRQGELLGLRWNDIDLQEGTLTVRHALQRIEGRRRLVEPKTAQSRRTIVLASTAVAALCRQRDWQEARRAAMGDSWQETGFVFSTRQGTPLDGSEVTRQFQKLLSAAGLPRKRFHDLRHSCATFLIAEGVSPRDIMAILGHSGIAVTMNTYAHVLPETQRAAAQRIDNLLKRGDDAG